MEATREAIHDQLRSITAGVDIGPQDEDLKHGLDLAWSRLSYGLVLGVATLAMIVAMALVGLVRGYAARDRMLASFGFSSPTRFLMARSGIVFAVIAAWSLSFFPLKPVLHSFVCSFFAGVVVLLGYLLAKHFPVVW